MRELKVLVDYVSPVRTRRLAFIRPQSKSGESQISRLYAALATGRAKSDEEACKVVFGKANDPRYTKVKHHLRELLINTVLLIDSGQNELGKRERYFVELRKQLYAGEVLWARGYPSGAVGILKRTLRKAIRYEMTEIVVAALPRLRSYYVSYEPNLKLVNKYAELYRKWSSAYQAEVDLRLLYDTLMANWQAKSMTPSELTELVQTEIGAHQLTYRGIETVDIAFYRDFVLVFKSLVSNEIEAGIQKSWETIGKLRDRPNVPRGYIRMFLLQIIGSALRLSDFQSGRKAVIEYLQIVNEGSHPWFRIYQLYMYLCIQSRKFDEAVEVTNRTIKHRRFNRLPLIYKERWFVLRAYLAWLIDTGNAGDTLAGELHKFRISKFVNEVVTFSKDKQGMNITVLIIQCLWLTYQQKYLQARKKFGSLERYGNRYLKASSGYERTYYFIKLITQLPKADFHKAAFKRKSGRYLYRLMEYDRPRDQQSSEVEVIPYDQLYHYVLNILDEEIH